MTTKKNKPVIAVSSLTGELEQFSSIAGAVTYLKSLNVKCTPEGIKKTCTGFNLKYLDRYWSYVE